jgi:hypothetical protein
MFDFKLEDDDQDSKLEINEKVLDEFNVELTKATAEQIKDQVRYNVIPSLGPKNFIGEALEYLKENAIPITDESVTKYSISIFTEFVNNIDELIQYDEASNRIIISPFITALEYGDLYRPVLKTITRAIDQAYPETSN